MANLPAHRHHPRSRPPIHDLLQPLKMSMNTRFRGLFVDDDKLQWHQMVTATKAAATASNSKGKRRQQGLQLLPTTTMALGVGVQSTPTIFYLFILLLTPTNRTSATTTRRVRCPLSISFQLGNNEGGSLPLVHLALTRQQRGGFISPCPFGFDSTTTRRVHPLLVHFFLTR